MTVQLPTKELLAQQGIASDGRINEPLVRMLCFKLRGIQGQLAALQADLQASKLANRSLVLEAVARETGEALAQQDGDLEFTGAGRLRVGRKQDRNLYLSTGTGNDDDDMLVGQLQHPAVAMLICERWNAMADRLDEPT